MKALLNASALLKGAITYLPWNYGKNQEDRRKGLPDSDSVPSN